MELECVAMHRHSYIWLCYRGNSYRGWVGNVSEILERLATQKMSG